MDEPSPVDLQRGRRALRLLSIVCLLWGSCGFSQAVASLQANPKNLSEMEAQDETSQAALQSARTLLEVLDRAPLHRPLVAMNIVLSVMLMVGSILLIAHRRSAPWWITNVVIANMLWTVAEVGTQMIQIQRSATKLASVLNEEVRIRLQNLSAKGSDDVPMLTGYDALMGYFVALVAFGLFRMTLYMWMVYRVRRPDVHAALGVK